MSQMLFWWIDDDASRERQFKYGMEKRLDIKLNFVSVQAQEIADKLEELVDKSKRRAPDLVIVDHVLNKTADSLIREGSIVADLIRKNWPTCPVVGVSAGIEKATILDRKFSYEELYPLEDFPSAYESLKVIASSFRKLNQRKPADRDEFIKGLRAPNDEQERIITILPDDLKDERGYSDSSLLQRMFRWVRHTLQGRPGFLYDRLWACTLVGVKETSFSKIAGFIETTRYNGIFNDRKLERWWSFLVKKKLYSKYSKGVNALPWELGREILGLTNRDFSICYVCGRKFPEIVGFTDQTAKKRVQLHIRCSVTHPDFERILYFEEMRMAKLK